MAVKLQATEKDATSSWNDEADISTSEEPGSTTYDGWKEDEWNIHFTDADETILPAETQLVLRVE